MNKAKFYPWIFAVVFGVVFGSLITILLANISLGDVKEEILYGGVFVGDYYAYCFKPSLYSILFMTIGLGSLAAATIYADRRDDANWLGFGTIILIILFLSLVPLALFPPPSYNSSEWIKDGFGEKIVNCIIVGTYIATSILIVNIVTIRWDSYKVLIASWSAGPILGIFVPWHYFNILLLASIGYAIGNPIAEKAKRRAEIKRREELERKWRIKEEERKRLEYERKISELKAKYEQCKREGYKPDYDLEEMLK